MAVATADPGIVILAQGAGIVTYQRLDTGEQWTVRGTCNCCGACEVGAVNPYLRWQGPVGTPMACVDVRYPDRLDMPVAPAFFAVGKHPTTCTLRLGEAP